MSESSTKSIGREIAEIAENQAKVYRQGFKCGTRADSKESYDRGYNEGYAKANTEAYEEISDLNAELEQTLYGTDTGGKSFYDADWDSRQDNGALTRGICTFAGPTWNDVTFVPKYDIIIVGDAYETFRGVKITDMVAALEKAGVILDFSRATTATATFHSANITRLGVLDFSSVASGLSQTFYNMPDLEIIEEIVLTDKITGFGNTFSQSPKLREVRISGVIAASGLSFENSRFLSKASITSIMLALSIATSGGSITFSKSAVESAFTTEEWNALIVQRNNWTVKLA